MALDAIELADFYDSHLGAVARRILLRRMRQTWPDVSGLRMLGLGYAVPYLRPFLLEAERAVAAMPAGQGVAGGGECVGVEFGQEHRRGGAWCVVGVCSAGGSRVHAQAGVADVEAQQGCGQAAGADDRCVPDTGDDRDADKDPSGTDLSGTE